MTTELSGMSLERVREDIIAFYTWEKDDAITGMCKMWVSAIDAHLSRDAVMSESDAIGLIDGLNMMANSSDATGHDSESEFLRCCANAIHQSFAARHAAVPDEIDHSDAPSGSELSSYSDRAYAQGWNACRKAMLAQRDGGTK